MSMLGIKNGKGTEDVSRLETMEALPLCFLGRRTLQKLYLMLHFGRMLRMRGPVRLDTINPAVTEETIYDYNGIEIHEHACVEAIHAVLAGGVKREEPGNLESRHLVDISHECELPVSGPLLLVMDPDRNSVETGMTMLAAIGEQAMGKPVHRVYLDLCASSRVGYRYLELLVSKNLPQAAVEGKWYAVEAEERNTGVILDNQHDDRLRLSRLSSSYHALLKGLAWTAFGIPFKESTRCIRQADKRSR